MHFSTLHNWLCLDAILLNVGSEVGDGDVIEQESEYDKAYLFNHQSSEYMRN